MRDKADLTDKAERLEHIVLQLQGETDTIGLWLKVVKVVNSCLLNNLHNHNHKNNHYLDDVYGTAIMTELLREFTWFI